MPTTSKMMAGDTVNIRVNAKDMMTCIDIVQGAGHNMARYSLAMIVSQALKGLCDFARQHELNGAKERDGYEYLTMTDMFRKNSQGTKIQATKEQTQQDYSRLMLDLPVDSIRLDSMGSGGRTDEGDTQAAVADYRIRRKAPYYKKLLIDYDDGNKPGLTQQQLVEVSQLRQAIRLIDNGQEPQFELSV